MKASQPQSNANRKPNKDMTTTPQTVGTDEDFRGRVWQLLDWNFSSDRDTKREISKQIDQLHESLIRKEVREARIDEVEKLEASNMAKRDYARKRRGQLGVSRAIIKKHVLREDERLYKSMLFLDNLNGKPFFYSELARWLGYTMPKNGGGNSHYMQSTLDKLEAEKMIIVEGVRLGKKYVSITSKGYKALAHLKSPEDKL